MECKSLESITIPKSVKWIDTHAFYGCTSLRKVTILGRPQFIESAFSKCESLEMVVLPSMPQEEVSILKTGLKNIPRDVKFVGRKTNSVSEDKIFAKEDDGGAPVGGGGPGGDGGVVAPPSTPGDSSGVVSPEVQPGLDTQDVLGKCDHGKNGFFVNKHEL